jgi:glycosyltransferase involved in cell wall biosynthesis
MKPIRVVHVITRLILGGAQETAVLLAAGVDQERFPSELVTGVQLGDEGELFSDAERRGIRVHREPSLVREISPQIDATAVTRLVMWFRRLRPDIVHTHSSKAGVVGRLAARMAGVPRIVHTVHGWSFHRHMPRRESATYVFLERMCARWCHRLVFVAEPNQALGLRLRIGRPDRYRLIRSGIEVERYARDLTARRDVRRELGFADGDLVFGNVSRLSPPKQPAALVRALASIRGRHPEARLLLVGEGPLRRSTEQAVADAGLRDAVRLTGLRTDVARFLSAMDVFVLATQWEGLPRVLPQAMAAGLPVVSSRVDGTPDAVHDDDNGFLIPPGDEDALADRMGRLAGDPELRASMGTRSLALVEEFSARTMVEKHERLYEELFTDERLP